MLTNLLENAIKYSPDGGPLQLEVVVPARQGEDVPWVEIAVTDHGIGIAHEERSRVFERFYRSTNVIADGFSGTGLGLYIVQQIVFAHGGVIQVADARHGGQGTTVLLSLPQQVAEAADQP